MTALEDAQTVLTLIERAGPVDSEQIRVVRVRRPTPAVSMVIDPGTNRGQCMDKDGNPLDADELAKRLGR